MKIFINHKTMINGSSMGPWKNKNLLAFLFIFFCIESTFGSVSICSWNLQNFGNSKSNLEVDFIASTIQNYDVIAIQEVMAGNGGAQVVTKLVDLMNRKGKSWDYTISNPTISSSSNTSERYAFVGQKTTLRMKCIRNDCLASEYDNFFYNPKKTLFLKSGIIPFYLSFSTIVKARRISDHVPIYLTFK